MKKLLLALVVIFVLFSCKNHEGVVSESDMPAFTKKVNMLLDNGDIELLGWYTEPMKPRHGESFKLVSFWKFNKKLKDGWKLFYHFEDAAGNERFVYDHELLDGKVKDIATGKIIKDVATLKEIPMGFDTDEMHILSGFFKGKKRTKPQKKYNDGKDRLKVGVVKISEPQIRRKKMEVFAIAGRSRDQIKIDGVLKESYWKNASTDDKFWQTKGKDMSTIKTKVMTVMDEKNLYVAFDVKDDDISAKMKNNDDPIYDNDDVVEIFIDPRGEGKKYYEMQVSAAGIKFDASFNGRRKNRNDGWDSKIKYAVKLDGTLNDSKPDKGWTAEIAIPWSSIADAPNIPPKDGESWKVFFYRINRHTGKKSTSDDFSAWTPPYAGDFHNIKFMGDLVFVYEEIL
jgi:hypothetical protein